MLPRSELRNPLSSVGMYFSYYLVNFGLGRIFSLVFPLLLIQAGWLMMREESFWERWPRWLGQVGLALAGAFTLSLFLARGLHEGATSGGWWVGSYVVLLSGYLIPVSLMPGWMQSVAIWSPFYAMSGLPTEIVMGIVSGDALTFGLARSLGWVLISLVLANLMWRRSVRHFGAFGG